MSSDQATVESRRKTFPSSAMSTAWGVVAVVQIFRVRSVAFTLGFAYHLFENMNPLVGSLSARPPLDASF